MKDNNKKQELQKLEIVLKTNKVTIFQNANGLQAMYDNKTNQFVTDFVYVNIMPTASTHRFIAVNKNRNKCQILTNRGELVIDKKFNSLIMQIDHLAIFGKDGIYDIYDVDGECACESIVLTKKQIEGLEKYSMTDKDARTDIAKFSKDKKLMVLLYVLSMAEQSYKIARSKQTCSEHFLANLDNYFDDFRKKMNKICELCNMSKEDFAKEYRLLTGRNLEEELLMFS